MNIDAKEGIRPGFNEAVTDQVARRREAAEVADLGDEDHGRQRLLTVSWCVALVGCNRRNLTEHHVH